MTHPASEKTVLLQGLDPALGRALREQLAGLPGMQVSDDPASDADLLVTPAADSVAAPAVPRLVLGRGPWRLGDVMAAVRRALEMGLRFGLDQAIGVFDARMPRIYGRLGHSPDVIGSAGEGRDQVSVGIWTITEAALAEIGRRSGLHPSEVAGWFDASFAAPALPEARVA